MPSCVGRQSRIRVGQWCACPCCRLRRPAVDCYMMDLVIRTTFHSRSAWEPYSFGRCFAKQIEFQCLYEVRDDLGQGTGGGTKNRAATPKDRMNQNENL